MATAAGTLRDHSSEELQQQLSKARQELFDLRLRSKLTGAGKPSQWGALRRQIARVLTVLREHERAPAATKGKS